MNQQHPPGWRPQGPQHHGAQHGYGPTHHQGGHQHWPARQPVPKPNHTVLYVVLGLGGAFLLLMVFLVVAAVLVGTAASPDAPQGSSDPAPPVPERAASPAPDPVRSAGQLDTTEFVTKPGYVIATSKEKLEAAVSLVASGDRVAFSEYVKSTPGVSLTGGNDIVTIVDSDGLFSTTVGVRKRGGTATFWTIREALQRP